MRTQRARPRRLGPLAASLAALAFPWGPALADDFAVAATPARFELTARPGSVVRGVLEVDNAAPSAATYAMKTADWALDPNAAALFTDTLQPGSCRPWVAIERHEITVSGHGSYRFRFEAAVPAGAPAEECRFAILIEGKEQKVNTKTGVAFPVAGRLGVIVYVTVGDAKPQLSTVGGVVAQVNGEPTPTLLVRNDGNAHGRLSGFLSGVDAKGARLEFTPATLPILPGETRRIPLILDQPDKDRLLHVAYPITIRGELLWSGGSAQLSQTFAP